MTRKVTYETWKKRAQACADRLALVDEDMFAESDPYDLVLNAERAWRDGLTPSAFVRLVFGEDLAERANDREIARGG